MAPRAVGSCSRPYIGLVDPSIGASFQFGSAGLAARALDWLSGAAPGSPYDALRSGALTYT